MKGILINPLDRTCREVDYHDTSIKGLFELLECTQLDSRKVADNETIIYGGDIKPDAYDGFVIPLPKGSVRVMGKALIVGVADGRNTDTALTPVGVQRHLFWAGVDHAVS
jgi:hypothetical protein